MEMKKVVEEELKKGWEATSQLRLRSKQQQQQLSDDKEEATESDDNQKMSIIINSFDTCISILQRHIQALDNNNSSQITSLRGDAPNNAPVGSQTLGKQRQLKSKNPCVKTVETGNLESDGYLWRKYGRKPILNARYPREYYRCAHRDDQQCPATKQVQMISKKPTKFNIIYYSHHTCHPDFYSNNIQNMLLDDYMLHNKDYYCPKNLICFDTKNPKQAVLNPAEQLHHLLHGSSSSSPPLSSSSSYVVPARHESENGLNLVDSTKKKKITSSSSSSSSSLAFDENDTTHNNIIYDSFKQTDDDVVYSPGTLMMMMSTSDNYYFSNNDGLQLQDYYTTLDGELQLQLQDHIPLWEDA